MLYKSVLTANKYKSLFADISCQMVHLNVILHCELSEAFTAVCTLDTEKLMHFKKCHSTEI